MLLTVEALREHAQEIAALPPALRGEAVNLTSGPVAIHADVQAAFQRGPISHRSAEFDGELRALKTRLCAMTQAPNVAVLLGSGTLANDVVAAQLGALGGRGIVYSNGEFGERLADHARCAGLDFEHRSFPWGSPLEEGSPDGASWVWLTACETSTGVMNAIAARGVKVALDCVSAIGAVPLDLSNVWLASGASGKALASYPGLSFVFYREVLPVPAPRYIDLALYAGDSIPFTHSSNLVRALSSAIARVDWPARYSELAATGAWLRARLPQVLPGDAPHVITLAVADSAVAAAALEHAGFVVSWASRYLRERNWIQVCLMGEVPREALMVLVREAARIARRQ
jgi:aspartate aminotransferase-like enzyme